MAGIEFSFEDNSAAVLADMNQKLLRGLEAVGLAAEGNAKVNITRQKAVDTGNLRGSISHKVVPSEKAVYIGTNVEYAAYVEYGTGEYAEGGGRRTAWVYRDDYGNFHATTGMKARPYLRPAMTKEAKTYMQILADEMNK